MAEFLTNLSPVETALTGCPDPTAGRAIIIPGGPASTATYVIRDAAGNPVNLSAYTTPPAGVIAYFSDVFCPAGDVYSAVSSVSDAVGGVITITIPVGVTQRPGIYKAEFWLVTDNTQPLTTARIKDETLVSVESSLMLRAQNLTQDPGPLTIGEVRMQLRDYPELNEYWRQHEFSVAEIVHSMIQPIYMWNETPPPIAKYNGTTFPYRHQWLEAVTANLMRTASAWLLRNARTIKYADGMTESDKDKYDQYLKLAEMKWQNYKQFCMDQKYAINLREIPGIHG